MCYGSDCADGVAVPISERARLPGDGVAPGPAAADLHRAFTSVLLFSAAIVAAMNLLPSLIAPIEFGGGWQLDASYVTLAVAQAPASGFACLFVFFAILALQGVLLNLLPRTCSYVCPSGCRAGWWACSCWVGSTVGRFKSGNRQ